ncbi:hypothetical protein JR316_0005398 [Psilocybe cubensis]|uniref:SH3 domain-containing protein n=2 Tax=Psilocybe cubensis TaxID=181762 RepID=A0A8H8CEX6_PSICU|nr:hypothetical protein JR316_0005398 [Psilocybe cubensis]KAH9483292.1 hypothetical protein JR316_0005398 [Psilocybe cubensis]
MGSKNNKYAMLTMLLFNSISTASRLSISLEGTASSSPFPSPSSSFIPPPTPGAHEFAVKPVPPVRNGKKTSTTNSTSHPPSQSQPLNPQVPSPPLLLPETDSGSSDLTSELKMHHEPSSQPPSLKGVVQAHISNTNGLSQLPPTSKEALPPAPLSPALISPMTPTPSSVQRKIIPKEYLEPPRTPGHAEQSHSSSTTPTIPISALPSEEDEKFASENSSPATATASSFPPPSSSLLPPSHSQDVDHSPSKIIIPDNLLDASIPGSGLSSPAFTPSSRPMSSADPSLFSNRPAPPSPAMSRRVSGAPSISSTRSRSSRPPSTSVSRTNSLRHSTQSTHSNAAGSARNSPVINPHRQSVGSQLSQSFAPLPSPQHLTFSLNVPQPSASGSSSTTSSSVGVPASPSASGAATLLPVTPATAVSTSSKRASAITYIKIRDFGFAPSDERHVGLGPEVPKPNRIGRMNRRLRGTRTLSTFSQGSVSSSDGDGEEEDEDDVDLEGWSIGGYGGRGGWDGLRIGLGRFNQHSGANAATVMENERQQQLQNQDFPSRMDLDRNFLDGDDMDDDDEYYDAAQDEEDEETLYPGLYRALYAFEPEGTAEMRLVEDQIVRVVGRGGGVGWAVVIDENAEGDEAGSKADGSTSAPKHALVPESYLEPVRLDWEDEDEEAAVPAAAAGGSGGEHDVATPVKNIPSITLA